MQLARCGFTPAAISLSRTLASGETAEQPATRPTSARERNRRFIGAMNGRRHERLLNSDSLRLKILRLHFDDAMRRLVCCHPRQQIVELVAGDQQALMLGADEAYLAHLRPEGEQAVIIAPDIEKPDWLGVVAELCPAHRLPQLVHRAGAAGDGDEAVGQGGGELLS